MSVWDDASLAPATSSYAKFVEVGDKVEGTIATLGKHTFPDGKACVQIEFVEPDAPILTAGQVMLASALFQLRPEVGEKLSVELTAIVPRSGKTIKQFAVKVTGKDGKTRTAA
jgi:hypothetical protein